MLYRERKIFVEEKQMNDIATRVKKVIGTVLSKGENEITDEASFMDDLGADSLDQVELVMALEEEFKDLLPTGQIPEDEASQLKTVGAVIRYIEEKASQK